MKGKVTPNCNSSEQSTKSVSKPDSDCECPDCSTCVKDGDLALMCEICEQWFHITCQKVNKTTYSFLLKNAGSREKQKVHWYCDRCDIGAGKILSSVAQISRKQDELSLKYEAMDNAFRKHIEMYNKLDKAFERTASYVEAHDK